MRRAWIGAFPALSVVCASGFTSGGTAQAQAVAPQHHAAGAATSKQDQEAAGWHALDESKAELQLVQVVFRHGARTPLSTQKQFWAHEPEWNVCDPVPPYPKPVRISVVSTQGDVDPVSSHNLKQMARKMPGSCFAGELTQLGHQQAFDLGQALRKRYVEQLRFLNPGFQSEAVRSRTTNFDRTIKTLRGVLSGLFPGHSGVIPVTTSSDVDEIMFADSKMCPHLGTFMALAKDRAKASVRLDPEYEWCKVQLKNILGLQDEFFYRNWAVTDVHDAMVSMKAHGKTLPAGMTDHLLSVVNRLATREFAEYVSPSINDDHGKAVMRLSMGVLLHTLVQNMEETVKQSSRGVQGPRLFLFSGHDSTIMPLLAAMGLDLTHWPPYLSNLVFELWKLPSGQHVVRCMYNLHDLQIPHCPLDKQPSLSTFTREVVGPFMLSALEWDAACKVEVRHDRSLPEPKNTSAMVVEDE